ncbi:hypothetical protein [Streptomyces sp. NPDC059708]|uniref:phage tail protein n=1 Tax=Streptomyces sp. NPDC059708 TaxID=3346916 RepID=UPI0036A7476B
MAGPGGREVGRINVKVLPDTDGFRERLNAFLQAIEDRARVNVQIHADTAAFDAEIAAATRNRDTTVQIHGDASRLDQLLDRVTRRNRRGPTVSPDVDAGAAEARLTALTRRRRVRIQAHLDRGFAGSVGRIFDGVRQAASGVGEIIAATFRTAFTSASEGASEVAAGVSRITSGMAGMAANVPTIAVMGTLYVALAGAISSAVAAIAVLAGAWIGLLALLAAPIAPIAIGVALIAFDEKLSATKDKAKETFEAIRETFSKALSDSSMLPALESALQRVGEWATGAQDKLKAFFDAGAKFVDPMVRSMQGLIDNFAGPFTQALDNLASSSFSESIVTGLSDLGTVLGDFFKDLSSYGDEFGEVFKALPKMLDPIVDGFARFAGVMAKIAPDVMVGIGEAIGKIFDAASDNPDMMASMAAAFVVMLDQFAQMAPLLIQIGAALAGFTASLLIVPAAISGVISSGIRWLVDTAFPAIGTFFTETIPQLWDSLYSSVLQPMGSFFTETIPEWWSGLVDGISSAWDGITSYLSSAWESIRSAAESAWNGIAEFFSGLWESISSTASSAWSSFTAFLASTWASITSGVQSAWQAIADFFSSLWSTITSTAQSAWSSFTSFLSSTWNSISATCSSVWNNIVSFLSSTWDSIKQKCTDAFNALKDAVTQKLNDVRSTVSQLPGQILSALGNLGGLLVSKGRELIQGFINGIKSMAGAVSSAVSSITSGLLGYSAGSGGGLLMPAPEMAPKALGYASPAQEVASVLKEAANVNTFGWGQKLGSQLLDGLNQGVKGAKPHETTRGDQYVTVEARTDANPFDIGREVAWAIRGM